MLYGSVSRRASFNVEVHVDSVASALASETYGAFGAVIAKISAVSAYHVKVLNAILIGLIDGKG